MLYSLFILKDSCASAAILEERPGTHLTEKKEKSYKDKLATGNLMPKGGTRVGGSDVFFWVENLHAQYFFGSRDLSHIFLGLKKYAFFGSYV